MIRLAPRREEHIKRRWRDVGHPMAFSGLTKLSDYYKLKDHQAKDILSQIDSYTISRQGKRPKYYNPFFIYLPREQIQADLIDVQRLAEFNNGYKYFVVLIDCLTRYVWLRPTKTKTAKEVAGVIKTMIEEMEKSAHGKPRKFFTDKGTELKNALLRRYLLENGIELMHPNSEKKASIVERVNRSLRGIIYRYMTENQTNRYIDVLQDLVTTYNERPHRSIANLAPVDAEKPENVKVATSAVIQRHSELREKIKEPIKFSVGDKVRVLINYGDLFTRGYREQFSEKLYEVVGINTRMYKPMYRLRDVNTGRKVDGAFYSNELQKARHPIFKIQVLKQKKIRGVPYLFVHWMGYSAKHDQWIKASEVARVYNQ
jgi:transposase InsO family protein